MTIFRVVVGHGRRLARPGAIVRASLLSTTARTELELDGVARVRLLNKRDAAADHEAEATMERLRGGELFSDLYPPNTLLHRLSALLEKSEAGDAVARAELESVVAGLDTRDQLLFYRLREQFMATQLETLRPEEIPAPASDDEWRQVMSDAVQRFQQIGRRLQQVEAEKRRATHEVVQHRSDTESSGEEETTSAADSDGAAPPESEMLTAAQIYTDCSDIHSHTDQDIGRFFDFPSSLLPEGLAGTINDEFSLTKTHKMMVRKAPYRIMSKCRSLGQADGYKLGTTVVLGGSAPGSGRSAALNYVTAWARSRPDWLTVFVPSADRFPQSGKQIVASRRHPDLFTQPNLQQEWLGELLRHQDDVLTRVPLKQKYSTEGLQSLRDLVQYGAENEDTNEVIFDVFAELRTVTNCNVMISIDRYNVWLRASAYRHPESGQPLPAAKLALVKGFMDLYDTAPVRGLTVASMTTAFEMPATAQLKREASPSTDIVTLPIYSRSEFDRVIAHWVQSGWLIDIPDHMRTFKSYASALSGRNPRELFRVLQSL